MNAAGIQTAFDHFPRRQKQPVPRIQSIAFLLVLGSVAYFVISGLDRHVLTHQPLHATKNLARCNTLKAIAGPPSDFHSRKKSDRFVAGTPPTWIRNARVWTGNDNGIEVLYGDILLDQGLIKHIGSFDAQSLRVQYGPRLVEVDAQDSWVTPGIIDIHSHLGVTAAPGLEGANDLNSLKASAQPWLRGLDGLNTHDDAYPLSISGGVTTSLILPGSCGQAFAIKLRHTEERTPSSMLVEPPLQVQINGSTHVVWTSLFHHICSVLELSGENPSREFSDTRMDTVWHFRQSYDEARKLVERQNDYCAKVKLNRWADLGDFPDDLRWEALADVIRGRTKVNIHCYEAVDIDSMIRVSNEFKFPIATFHHAQEMYLVPEVLRKAWGPTPGVALFATYARFKRESYRASEFAPRHATLCCYIPFHHVVRILASHGIDVSMKSDHAVLDSRFLIYEAQQAHMYGLPANLALASVITTSARMAGLDHRLGYVREGWDADLVIWDSHPLNIAATPKQVYIDGIAQLNKPHLPEKPAELHDLFAAPNFDKQVEDTLKWDGLPPLRPKFTSGDVLFVNVTKIFSRQADEIWSQTLHSSVDGILVRSGRIICVGARCQESAVGNAMIVNLQGGSIFPGLTTFGAPLGMSEIYFAASTNDGVVYDPFISGRFSGETTLFKAIDGLSYGGRNELLAYTYGGVTTAVSAPRSYAFLVDWDVTAVHITITQMFGEQPSVSTQIGVLRKLLLEDNDWFGRVANGTIPLVVAAVGRDIIASLIHLKKEVEAEKASVIKLTIAGGSEAHLIAKELGEARIGVIVNPPKPFPTYWEKRRILAGPPLTKDTIVTTLIKNNVTVALGVTKSSEARNLRFELSYAALQAGGSLSTEEALALGSTNVEKLLGVVVKPEDSDLVAVQGGSLLDFSGVVTAIISPRRGLVDLVERGV
ncbi:composite domain of metallo-dependent hydrolase [Flagelloscypha sp. PMI_526]|nr:composite domain of metallo-dependent hydrolase [Flagelloscypha sp. PMI_526]